MAATIQRSPMYGWDGISHNYRHHPLAHGTADDFNELAVSGYRGMLFAIDRWNVGEFAKLLTLLDGCKEQDGTSLLGSELTELKA